MIGILLIFAGGLFDELSSSLGKRGVSEKRESTYTLGFLNLFWAVLIFFIIAMFRGNFYFSPESLPYFIPRLILELIQAHVSLLALRDADRSTFGFLRVLTVPLLLLVDMFIGNPLSVYAVLGISVICLGLLILTINHGLGKRGKFFVLFSAVNAVATISLYKFDITHFNSVEAEQSIVYLALMLYFFVFAIFKARENPLRFIFKPYFLAQSFSVGVASIAVSFAYLFASASVVTAAKRAVGVLWSVLSGRVYFKEKGFFVKMTAFFLVLAGFILLL